MDRKNDLREIETTENGEYTPRRSRKFDAVMAVLALVAALFVWLAVMNGKDTAACRLRVMAAPETCEYTLSVTELEIEGKRADLRRAREIGVVIPDRTTVAGVYTLTEDDLVLPEGTVLTGPVVLTLTVRAK